MAIITRIARHKKLDYFFGFIEKEAAVLDVGSADGWVAEYAIRNGWSHYLGIDIADSEGRPNYPFIHGDVNEWERLGIKPESFDAVIAFEVLEHGDFFASIACLLKPDGLLLATTPVPHMDWLCKILESARLTQRRTSPHSHLIDLTHPPVPFKLVHRSVKAAVSQWVVLRKDVT